MLAYRYIGIIHPIKAHILCNRRRIAVAVTCIWPAACVAGLPTLLFNVVRQGHPQVRLALAADPREALQSCLDCLGPDVLGMFCTPLETSHHYSQ